MRLSEQRGVSTALMVVLAIISMFIGGFFLWACYGTH